MITERQIEQIVEKLVDRIEIANTKFLKSIGSSIKQIRSLTSSQAQQLIQILKYGGKYEDIIKEIAKITALNINDIDAIFSNYAKKDQMFYEKFYKYKDITFTPFDANIPLKTQTMALSNIVKNEMYNFTRSNVLGYTINGKFYNLRETYNQLLDEAFLNVGQGKETFDGAMQDILKQVGGSGLKTLNYESGRSIRLDSAIRMQLQGRLRELHNENQKIIGDEFGADGYEISVHENPAEDHEQVQGRQFSFEEYDKLNSGLEAKDYKGKIYTLDHDGKNGYRPISEMNCYHYIFSIILGVSEPEYDDKQLNQIINNNNKGFDYEGKHYTNYQGTQMQRNLERAIREQKDIQILAKASGNDQLVAQSQEKIRILTNKYKELNKASGLPPKADRLRVSGYRRTKTIGNYKEKPVVDLTDKVLIKEKISDFSKYREIINDSKTLPSLEDDFNYKDFISDYNEWYDSLDKKELEKTYDDYKKWLKTDMNTSNPIGDYLNKKFKYDAKPELIDEKDFWISQNGEIVEKYYNSVKRNELDENHWFRGISGNTLEETKNMNEQFKTGDYYAGIGINGNGTYATSKFNYAERFAKNSEEGIIYMMPKENAKIIDIDKVNYIKAKLPRHINSEDELYIDFTTTVLSDNGYFAEILGYDIVNLGAHKIILNRGAIKVVK